MDSGLIIKEVGRGVLGGGTPPITKRQVQNAGHRSQVTGHRSQVTGYRAQVTENAVKTVKTLH